jgi:lauroyl/myristoyl acyltransferase
MVAGRACQKSKVEPLLPVAVSSSSSRPEAGHHSSALYRASMFSWGAWLARWMPLAITRAFAGLLGKIYALRNPDSVACVWKNLQLLDAGISKQSAGKVYEEFGKTLADYFYITTRQPVEAMKIIREETGYPHLEELRKKGIGGVIVTAHLGLFELGGLIMAHHGFPTAVLTLPEPSSGLTEWRAQARKKWGAETIEVGSDAFVFLDIAKRLREGWLIAALIDRPNSPEPSPVKFPNGIAGFSSGILLVAQQCGVPVVPATMVRLSNGFYRAQVFEPITIEPRGSRAETLQFYSQQIADILMPTLCAHPEQWYQFTPLT